MPPRRQQWSLALPVACRYMNGGAAASLDLPGGAEICNLALFLHGHGKLIIQEIQMKKLFRVIYKPKETNSSRLHLGSFPTQGAPRLFRVGVCGQPTQGDELTRLIWLPVDEQRLTRSLPSSLQGSTIIGVHATCQAAAGSRIPQDLCWDRRCHRRSSWSQSQGCRRRCRCLGGQSWPRRPFLHCISTSAIP